MAVTRHDLFENGFVYLRTRYAQNGAPKLRKAIVISIERAAAKIQTLDDNRMRVCRWNELEPDEEYLAERDQEELRKRAEAEAAARREAAGIPREQPPSAPTLATPIAAVLAAKGADGLRVAAGASRRRTERSGDQPLLHSVPRPADQPTELLPAAPPAPEAPEAPAAAAPPPPPQATAEAPVIAAAPQAPAITSYEDWLGAGRQLLTPLQQEIARLQQREVALQEELAATLAKREQLQTQASALELILSSRT